MKCQIYYRLFISKLYFIQSIELLFYLQTKILKGFRIYIDSEELSYLKEQWRNKPFEFSRRLMKLIIGRKELKKMTPTGRAGTRKIPTDIFKAVFSKLLALIFNC